MQRLGTLPIYTEPKDKRVLKWLNKQVIIHDLAMNTSLEDQRKPPPLSKGNGTVRAYLADAVTLLLFVGVIYACLVLAAAFEVPR